MHAYPCCEVAKTQLINPIRWWAVVDLGKNISRIYRLLYIVFVSLSNEMNKILVAISL